MIVLTDFGNRQMTLRASLDTPISYGDLFLLNPLQSSHGMIDPKDPCSCLNFGW
jgi:hypothetical protein